jgi:hypothetical protein
MPAYRAARRSIAMVNEDRSVVRETASGAGTHIVQSGWYVNDRDGQRIGRVVERDRDTLIVALEGSHDRIPVPTDLISEEDENAMVATLSVASAELDDATPMSGTDEGPEPPPLPLA